MGRDRASRPEARPLRLFVAIDIPESVRSGLARDVEPLRELVPGARWTRPEAWHVTLRFLGNTWPRLTQKVRAAVGAEAAGTDPFETALTRLGAFPGDSRARVLWVGLSDEGERFRRIAKSLDDLLEPEWAPEKRPFTPHLTLARLNPPQNLRRSPPEVLGRAVASSPFPVGRLVLYRSHLSPRGARYEALERFSLGSGAAESGPGVEIERSFD